MTNKSSAAGSAIPMNAVLSAYKAGEEVSNDQLYGLLAKSGIADCKAWEEKVPVGKSGQPRNLLHRKARWQQQVLRQLGLIEKVEGKRAVWRLKAQAEELTPAAPGVALVAFSTDLGLALWANCADVFSRIDEPVHMVLTSPPFPLRKSRAYGGVHESEFVDFICRSLEPVVKNLVRGGSVCLQLSNDVFLPNSPARSLYVERTTIALHERLGLFKQDSLVWENPCKPPGPMQWASRTRQQLRTSFEWVLWFTNDPKACFSDNRRVLEPHSARHAQLIESGGEKRRTSYGDGAYRLRPGSFALPTAGRIPRNIITVPHNCAVLQATRKAAIADGLPTHGATMPVKLAKQLIEFMTNKGDLVVDLFGGWIRTGLAAEELGRRWIATEMCGEYIAGGAYPFRSAAGFEASFALHR